jgi:hypothetical protein
MGIMIFFEGILWGAMYRASSDGSKKRNGDDYYRYEPNLSSKITTWRSARQIRNFWHYKSSGCNKRKFADWQTMKLGSENLSAMYQPKTDGCNNTGW